MSRDFDLIVIGGGSGGLAGAFRAASHGARVALLEPEALGGTCVNAGCVPKKAMWLAAEVGRKLGLARPLGFDVEPAGLDWPTFIGHRQRYIGNIHESYRRRLDEAGIAVLAMRGALRDAGTVACGDGVYLRAKRILLATGARASRPPIAGAELGGTSDDFFGWVEPPRRVAVIGGGYIGVELAGVLQALGSQVELLVRGQRLLTPFDEELSRVLADDYRQSGIGIRFGCEASALEREGGRVRVVAEGLEDPVFDRVLFATGRVPNTAGLGLEQVGVELDRRGHVRVDARHDTSVEGIHAVGDVTPGVQLTPVAIAAARRLMDRLFAGRDRPLDAGNIPSVVFSHPPLGMVGLTTEQAMERHGAESVSVYRAGFRPMLNALADVPQRSLFKLVCVGSERRVVGVHLLGEAADEILQGFAVAVRMGATIDDLNDTVAIHPTSAEEVVLMQGT
ncbi:glutathione-disulfide reductase [Novilysobacter defluvii]|uniref:Glutathione reductase n=1 Tax=Lysobacter defluvii IMMIB APB-9 = DSM 18482 TaxID=1385515 RepID=A0A0A0M7G8_9GAMM|nr:glutathione-disulfide reductase [Lysobacter defluvii]KGO97942.1 glutathione reductase [Lysobacter defluvii IMMIB APB-9 = DSM 18482]